MTDAPLDIQKNYVNSLIAATVEAFKKSSGDASALHQSVLDFFNKATATQLSLEEIENILGIDENSILDLAELSEDDEEIIIEAFENISNS